MSAVEPLVNDARPAPFDPDALSERLAAFGLDGSEQAALRAFSCVVDADVLGRSVLAAMESVDPRDDMGADEPAPWRFCRAMGRLAHCDLQSQEFSELLHLWLACYAAGAGADYAFQVAKTLLDCCSEALVPAGRGPTPPEFQILCALQRVTFCVVSLFGEAAHAYDGALRAEAQQLDAASGLPNAERFTRLLDEHLAHAGAESVGLVVIQVDHDKTAMPMLSENDRHLCRSLTDRMRRSLREQDILCMLGPFEWALILPALRSPAQVALACNRVVEACLAPIRIDDRKQLVIARAGGACAPQDAADAQALLRAARLALDVAQKNGSPYELHRTETRIMVDGESALEQELLEALTNNRLQLALQPQVYCVTGRCDSAEALVRWQRRSGEFVPPPVVIATVERLGAQRIFSRWLINRAARLAAELHRAAIDVRFNINLTASDIQDVELPDLLGQAMSTWGVPAGRLGIELTESAVIADADQTHRVLSRVRDLGCAVAIDDFGTGYSSMVYLRRLPLQEIKLDQVFVRDVVESPQDRAIVGALVQLAHSLGLRVVAEGVETEATLAVLRAIGCELAQGFLFSEPVPISQFIAWWRGIHSQSHTGPDTARSR